MKSRPISLILLIVLIGVVYIVTRRPTRPITEVTQLQPNASQPGQPQSFDYYLLNLSWSPEFCHSHPDAVECSEHATFILHGLWPQNLNGTYPENCSDAPGPGDPTQYSDIYPDQSLLAHEWKTHGTCSGLGPDTFFQLARQATHTVTIPTQLASIDRQLSMPPDEIIGLFTKANPTIPASSLAISCGNNYLTAVEVCFNKSLQPIACGPIRSCRANTVRISPPQ